jgi:hypothetical protein
MKEAIEMYIEALKKEGNPIPEPTTTARSITIAAQITNAPESGSPSGVKLGWALVLNAARR